jgi:primosomal protein N' (replication factor Y)
MTRGRDDHERILTAFLNHEADILIGTQMVAKGLDLPLVTLVGVISADISLNLPDYRSGERTYQLLMQVAGRAGRGLRPGRVIIQTYDPSHPAIVAAARYDGPSFYARELEVRRRLGYPPFGEIIRLLFSHTNEDYGETEARRIRRSLEARRIELDRPTIDIIGPAPAYIRRLRGRYRWQVLLRGDSPHTLLEGLHLPQGWTVDVDPVSLL